MNCVIEAHSWIGDSLANYLRGVGVDVIEHAVNPGGDCKDYIYCQTYGGISARTIREAIMSCDIPSSMFTIK